MQNNWGTSLRLLFSHMRDFSQFKGHIPRGPMVNTSMGSRDQSAVIAQQLCQFVSLDFTVKSIAYM